MISSKTTRYRFNRIVWNVDWSMELSDDWFSVELLRVVIRRLTLWECHVIGRWIFCGFATISTFFVGDWGSSLVPQDGNRVGIDQARCCFCDEFVFELSMKTWKPIRIIVSSKALIGGAVGERSETFQISYSELSITSHACFNSYICTKMITVHVSCNTTVCTALVQSWPWQG